MVDAAAEQHAGEGLAGDQPVEGRVAGGGEQREHGRALEDRLAAGGAAVGRLERLVAGGGPGLAFVAQGVVAGGLLDGGVDAAGQRGALVRGQREEGRACLTGQVDEALQQARADRARGQQAAVGAALGRGLQQPGVLG